MQNPCLHPQSSPALTGYYARWQQIHLKGLLGIFSDPVVLRFRLGYVLSNNYLG